MTDQYSRSFADWRFADDEARKVETDLARAWQEFHAEAAEPPTAELIRAVSRARSRANDKLSVALGAMRSAVRERGGPTRS